MHPPYFSEIGNRSAPKQARLFQSPRGESPSFFCPYVTRRNAEKITEDFFQTITYIFVARKAKVERGKSLPFFTTILFRKIISNIKKIISNII